MLALALFLLTSLCPLPLRADSAELSVVSQRLIAGTVPLITTTELAKIIASDEEILLLDTREKKEYEVSHLPGALWVGFEDFKLERVEKISPTARIVVYCSVGYRSEKIGEKLKQAGFQKVENLFSGLFAWANEGRPLIEKQGEVTRAVHGFDAEWSRLLAPKVKMVLE